MNIVLKTVCALGITLLWWHGHGIRIK